MNTSLLRDNIRRQRPFILILALILIALITNIATADTAKKNPKPADGEGPQGAAASVATVVIAKKSLEHVVTIAGDRYTLSSGSIITGLDGKQLSIRQMLVPCDAEITYEISKGVRVVQRIKVVRVVKDARWQWVSDQPE